MELALSIRIETIFKKHQTTIFNGFDTLDPEKLSQAANTILACIRNNKTIYTIGNGASASIAEHWACDYFKGCSGNGYNPRVISLAANIPLMTAISNDISYDEVYSYQIERLGQPGDVLIAISSSGNSPNIIRAIQAANDHQVQTIALTGFSGGKAKDLANICVHAYVDEYEATEDIHQAIMHTIAKYIRKNIW